MSAHARQLAAAQAAIDNACEPDYPDAYPEDAVDAVARRYVKQDEIACILQELCEGADYLDAYIGDMGGKTSYVLRVFLRRLKNMRRDVEEEAAKQEMAA